MNFFRTLPSRTQKTLETVIRRGVYYGPANHQFKPKGSVEVAGVMRDRFDHEYALAACDEGAELLDQCPVTGVEESPESVRVKTKRGVFEARFLVAADGATGPVKRLLNLGSRTAQAAALEMEIPRSKRADSETPFMIHFDLIRDGYAWAIPKGSVDSVGVASFNRDRQKVRLRLQEWLRCCGYQVNGQIIHGHPIPVYKNQRLALATRRSLLVGDAASTVDPLGGEGIRYGIQSARIAAGFIQQGMKTNFLPDGYSEAITKNITSDFRYARWVAGMVYRFPAFSFKLFVSTELGTRLIGRILSGEIRYRHLFQKAFETLFKPRCYRRLFQKAVP